MDSFAPSREPSTGLRRRDIPFIYKGSFLLIFYGAGAISILIGSLVDPKFAVRPGILNVAASLILGLFFGWLAAPAITCIMREATTDKRSFWDKFLRPRFHIVPAIRLAFSFWFCCGLALGSVWYLKKTLKLGWPWFGYDQPAVDGAMVVAFVTFVLTFAVLAYRWYARLPE